MDSCLLVPIFFLLFTPCAVAQSNSSPSPDAYGYARVTPSMAIIIVVLISALFFMGFFSIYIRHCNNSSGSIRPLAGANPGRSRRAARGLDPEIIETFPIMVYSVVKGHKIGKGALECAVCLNEFEDDDTLRLIPKCDHVFHPDCIDAWLNSHTTCPVCRANLSPQPGDPAPLQATQSQPELDLEAQQSDAEELEPENTADVPHVEVAPPEAEVMSVNQTLKRNRTRGSRSGRPPKFPRSHSTGHSLVQPGENTERFTLRLPAEVRKQLMNRELNRTLSLVALPRGGSSRRGYRTGTGGEGSSRGKYFNFRRIEKGDQNAKSDRWVFNITPPSFLGRASSFLTRTSPSVRSPKVAASDGEGTSTQPVESKAVESGRLPV
ncbi:hypothetical protein K2173_027219 [Erythroxylum novogranatense]|uniref:RING-type E3 ubiquitin transferase n=1 Tax=Erythroxylum novogranatense TaxID=1862640 RepID=A0AAV8TYC6_9ROSI|nr:hypothetical protein K2173_027219 [Erythroxylum novogranatense]